MTTRARCILAAAIVFAACGGAANRGVDKLTASAASGHSAAARSETETAGGVERPPPGGEPGAPHDALRERARREFGVSEEARDLDPEVLSVLDGIDRAQVEFGIQARTYAADPRVRALTDALMIEHARAIAQRERLVERINARPRESAQSARVGAESHATLARLGRLRGPRWDAAYLSAAVAHHARTLSLIDLSIAPVVTAPELRALLADDVRPRAARDLALTQALRAELGSTGGP